MAPTTVLLAVLAICVMAEDQITTMGFDRSDLRIIHGKNAEKGQFPWQAFIECIQANFMSNGCGGSLISDRHVLTAAHCVNRVLLCQVSLGLISLTDRGYSYYLSSRDIIVHDKYESNTYINDIAIIQLPLPVQITENMRPIRLANEFQNSKTLTGKSAVISGWGKTRDGEAGLHNFLQYTNVKIMPENQCNAYYMKNFGLRITDGHICTNFSPSNVCNGDSGGPLCIYDEDNKWTLIGVVSLGINPCEEGQPAVFTSVSHYLPWIRKNTQN